MFTGLVERTGEITSIQELSGGARLGVDMGKMAFDIEIGDSVCTNGVCLTVVTTDNNTAYFDLSPQTLDVTNFDALQPGCTVNLERSLRVGDRLGGHFLSGHVDDISELLQIEQHGDFSNYIFSAPSTLLPLMVDKGSIGVDGVSLTIARLDDANACFEVALIPETLNATNLGAMQVGTKVHLEADILAKHVQRLLATK
ncbi:MAG: riboflavin synthase [Planctomycetes bacterium]|nr:riboflavin synthase [Planctomycetota bacterium]